MTIIEGMRNSLAHGNVRFVNISKLNDINDIKDIKIEFTNIYEGKTCFKMTVSLYDLQLLFEDCNIQVINEFLHNNKKEKVLTK